jgi:hypothetical protein
MTLAPRFRAGCDRCEVVALGVEVLRLQFQAETGVTAYSFTCPTCGALRQPVADAPTAELLQAMGVVTEVVVGQPVQAVTGRP